MYNSFKNNTHTGGHTHDKKKSANQKSAREEGYGKGFLVEHS